MQHDESAHNTTSQLIERYGTLSNLIRYDPIRRGSTNNNTHPHRGARCWCATECGHGPSCIDVHLTENLRGLQVWTLSEGSTTKTNQSAGKHTHTINNVQRLRVARPGSTVRGTECSIRKNSIHCPARCRASQSGHARASGRG